MDIAKGWGRLLFVTVAIIIGTMFSLWFVSLVDKCNPTPLEPPQYIFTGKVLMRKMECRP